jgi:hypothetical protein
MKHPAVAFAICLSLLTATLAFSIKSVFEKGTSSDTPFPMTDVKPFIEPVYFCQATYCDPGIGDKIRGAEVVWRAGDGKNIPAIFIARGPDNVIVVSSQGTNITDLMSIENVSQRWSERVEQGTPYPDLSLYAGPDAVRTCSSISSRPTRGSMDALTAGQNSTAAFKRHGLSLLMSS